MEEPFVIDARELYDYAKSRGYDALLDPRFELTHDLRVSIQTELFGKGHTPQENEKFYRWVWNNKPHYCEECMRPLRQYSATFVSHILSRGAHPEMAHDPRNTNILCFEHHAVWENGRRQSMRIYSSNKKVIEKLKKEYGTDRV